MLSWILFMMIVTVVPGYHTIIIPGIGGSVLKLPDRDIQIWPPHPLYWQKKYMEVDCNLTWCESRFPLTTSSLGDLDGIRVDNPFTYLLTKSSFYNPLIKKLQKQNATVSAFSYDFRQIYDNSPYLLSLYQQFRCHLEELPGKSVIICHSLGGLLFHDFLISTTSSSWQQRHLAKIYFINVPFGGSSDGLFAILKNSLGSPPLPVPLIKIRMDTLHHFAGLYWCLPLSGPLEKPILRYRKKWYSTNDIPLLFQDLDMPISNNLFSAFQKRIFRDRCRPIHIPSYIIYGTQKNTSTFLDWESQTYFYEDGDRVVPTWSLTLPKLYYNLSMTYFIEIPGMDHTKVDECPVLFEYLANQSFPCYNTRILPNNQNKSIDTS